MFTMKDFIEKKIAVRTGTGENLKKFLALCEKEGLTWACGEKATEFLSTVYGEETTLVFDFEGKMKLVSNKGLTFGNKKHDKINGFEIVDVSEFLKEPEPAPKDYTIVISCADGKTTVAGMLVNGKCVKVVEANLDPRDEFNFRIGAETAFNRLFEKRH